MLAGPLEWTRLRLLTGKYLCENAHVSVCIESRANSDRFTRALERWSSRLGYTRFNSSSCCRYGGSGRSCGYTREVDLDDEVDGDADAVRLQHFSIYLAYQVTLSLNGSTGFSVARAAWHPPS